LGQVVLTGTLLYWYLSDDVDTDDEDIEVCVTNIGELFSLVKPHGEKKKRDSEITKDSVVAESVRRLLQW